MYHPSITVNAGTAPTRIKLAALAGPAELSLTTLREC